MSSQDASAGPVQRHYCSTAYVTQRKGGTPRTLLHWHKKIGSWLPPGGHVEPNELPHEAALREVLEETGLKVTLEGGNEPKEIREKNAVALILPQPHHIQVEEIEAGKHFHIDFIFFSAVNETATMADHEGNGSLKWFDGKELRALPPDEIFNNTRIWALESIWGHGKPGGPNAGAGNQEAPE